MTGPVPMEVYGRLLATLNADPSHDTQEQADLRAVVNRAMETELALGRIYIVVGPMKDMMDGLGIMPGAEST